MDWRTHNRNTGPEMPDLKARSGSVSWNGKPRLDFKTSLRPGRLHQEQAQRGDPKDEHIPEMGDLERSAFELRLPDNPIDVRNRNPSELPHRGAGGVKGKRGARPKSKLGESKSISGLNQVQPSAEEEEEARLREEDEWNASSFCPAKYHPKSVLGVVQSNLKEYHASTRALLGGQDGQPLDPHGLFADMPNDPTYEQAAAMYRDPYCYPRW